MFVTYMHCDQYRSYTELEPDLAPGYVIAWDKYRALNELDYDSLLRCNESLWIIPGTIAKRDR